MAKSKWQLACGNMQMEAIVGLTGRQQQANSNTKMAMRNTFS